jgi:hypothetical protein
MSATDDDDRLVDEYVRQHFPGHGPGPADPGGPVEPPDPEDAAFEAAMRRLSPGPPAADGQHRPGAFVTD